MCENLPRIPSAHRYRNMSHASIDLASLDLRELRRAAVEDPRNAILRYLLAAELAQQQEHDAAILEFTAAIALDPALDTARLQLALLHLTLAQPEQALAALAPLANLADGEPLKYFKAGLEALAHDNLLGSLQALQQGVASNTSNPVLNRDMQLIIDRLRETLATSPADSDLAVRTDFSLYGMVKH